MIISTGLAATFGSLVHFKPKRIWIDGGYHGTHQSIAVYQRLSPAVEVLDLSSDAPSLLEGRIAPGDLVWLESPKNPYCEVADMAAFAQLTASVAGAHTVVDSTFAPPPLQVTRCMRHAVHS